MPKQKPRKFSQEIEDYLKAIYQLEQRSTSVSNRDIAGVMGVRPASVTGMMKKLARLNLVRRQPYRGVQLTPPGRKIALEIIRHHRLLELFLVEAMGYSWDRVHEEADRLEHHISEDFEDRMAKLLGHPVVDPHGDPIPTKEGAVASLNDRSLDQLEEGEAGRVSRISGGGELLRHAAKLGFKPQARIRLLAVEPFDGSLRVAVEGEETLIGRRLAEHVFVT